MPKKTRATKKTDVKGEKPWLKKAGIQGYAIGSLPMNKSFLIVCEGQTEELYFKSFPVSTVSVRAIHLGCSKSSLVDNTLAMDIDNYDEIWCVFDFDEKKEIVGQIDDFNDAIRKADNKSTDLQKIQCAYSNDSFELWFFLHYHFTDEQHHRTFYFEKLSKYWDVSYESVGKARAFALKIYDKLQRDSKADQSQAIERAKKLHQAMASLPFHKQNPVTTVFKLVEELNKFLKR